MTRINRRLWIVRGGLTGVGAVLVLVNLLVDRVGLGEPSSFGLGQILLVIAGAALILLGVLVRAQDVRDVRAFGRRVRTLYRGAALLLLNLVVLLAAVEIVAFGLSFAAKKLPAPAEVIDARVTLDVYAANDWAADYWAEFLRAAPRLDYQPFVLWKTSSFEGETINVDEAGIRMTPGVECVEGAYRVFAFGGSTMWGVGAPDWGTIPAYLQTELVARRQEPVCVVNFGETAFVSTQEVIRLMMQLQAGNVPDMVIFYDGINDVYATYQTGIAGVHQNLEGVAARFEQRPVDVEPPLVAWLQETATYKLLADLAGMNDDASAPVTVLIDEESEQDLLRLVEPVVRVYRNNYEMVGALAETYGFEYAFFWQPVISSGEKVLTQEEQGMILSTMSPALVAFYDAVYREIQIAAQTRARLFYIADVFDGLDAPLWIDFVHVTPEGNRLVAQTMLQVLE